MIKAPLKVLKVLKVQVLFPCLCHFGCFFSPRGVAMSGPDTNKEI